MAPEEAASFASFPTSCYSDDPRSTRTNGDGFSSPNSSLLDRREQGSNETNSFGSSNSRSRGSVLKMAILYTLVLVCTSPFGWIAGQMSELDRSLPFVLLLVALVAGDRDTFVATEMAARRAAGMRSDRRQGHGQDRPALVAVGRGDLAALRPWPQARHRARQPGGADRLGLPGAVVCIDLESWRRGVFPETRRAPGATGIRAGDKSRLRDRRRI